MNRRFSGRQPLAACLALAAGLLGAPAQATRLSPEVVATPPEAPASARLTGRALIDRGREIFIGETFAGNGRTCATCHRPENDFTIDPAFIATVPKSDPLFVFEREPALRGLDFSGPVREQGLFVVHPDGFAKPAVLRSPQHLLGLRVSQEPAPFSLTLPGQESDLVAATGWSGDGAPGNGSLRNFAVGAIAEHLPKTLRRRPGLDFRLPTAAELDALEAYMLSLGRREDINIANFFGISFSAPLVERGRELFNSEVSGSCSFCHGNGGALDENGFNNQFDTGVARRRLPGPAIAGIGGDGGFGPSPRVSVGGRTGYGDGRFNTPSLLEAADTPPFFHNNSARTIEDAVRFYTTDTFAQSPEGQALPVIALTSEDVVAIAALLRTLNAMENIRSANALMDQAAAEAIDPARVTIRLAMADSRDALGVLSGGPRRLYPVAAGLLRQALASQREALERDDEVERDRLLRLAAGFQNRARASMVD